MTKLIQLHECETLKKPFNIVTVIVGIDGPKKVCLMNGTTAMVTTLSLRDATVESDIELSLWDTDSMRASSLRMLDIVLARDVVMKRPTNRDGDNATRNASLSVRLALYGASASVRLLVDSTLRTDGGGDTVSQAAGAVMQWRDAHFSLLMTMRRRGALWTRDEARHGEATIPTRGQQPRCEDAMQIRKAQIPQTTEGNRLAALAAGGMAAATEVGDVRVRDIYLRAEGMRKLGKTETSCLLRDACWRGCMTCDARALNEHEHPTDGTKNDREAGGVLCVKCGGDMQWRFGDLVFKLSEGDGASSVLAHMCEQDVPTLLFEAQASDVVRDARVAEWAADVLRALLEDSGRFTVLLAKAVRGHKGDVRLRRLLV